MDQLINSSKMATELAEVYIRNIYGEKASKSQKPYIVTDSISEWTVEGKPPSALGGNFKIILSKKDGQVLKITHSK